MSRPAQPLVEPVETPPTPTEPHSIEPAETRTPQDEPPLVEPVETLPTPVVPRPEETGRPRAEPRSSEPIGTADRASAGSPDRRPRSRAVDHPEWSVLAIAAAGWVGLASLLGWLTGSAAASGGHHHDPGAPPHAHSFDAQLLVWMVMVAAMMLPTTVPHVRYLAFNTRPSRRQRSIGLFLLGYLAVWLVPGLVLALVQSPAPAAVIVAGVLAAGVWELTPAKRRALRRCCRTWPVGYSGARADAAAVDYGLRHGVICLLVTGPAMAALMLAGHPWWATVTLAAVMAAQKLLSRPERWRAMVSLGWLASGLALAGVALTPG